jgi:hypothetical protein
MDNLSKEGIYDTVDQNFILSGVKMRLGMRDTTVDDMYLTDIINRGVKRLRNLGTMIPFEAKVPIQDFRAPLPSNFIRFTKTFPIRLFFPVDLLGNNGLFLTNSSTETVIQNIGNQTNASLGVATQTTFNGNISGTIPVFLNGAFYDGLGGIAIQGVDEALPYITVNVVNSVMYFSTNCNFTYAYISYLGNLVDESGSLLVPAYAEEALTEFVLYQYKTDNADKYPAYVIQMHENNWKRGKMHVKAIAAMPSSVDYQFINHKINALK